MTETGKKTLLVVDDDPDMRGYVRRAVSRLCPFVGEVREASTGQQALEMVRHGGIELLITDVQLPGLDGISLCRLLESTAAGRPCPVLLISGESSRTSDAFEFASDVSHRAFLAKPFNAHQTSTALAVLEESAEGR